jgi:MFS family permease
MSFRDWIFARRTFLTVWLGQLVSILGSGLSDFALMLWVYEHSGSLTQFTLAFLFKVLPAVIVSPFAGVLVDRWDRRRILIWSDTAAALATAAAALLFFSGQMQVWHVYLIAALHSLLSAFQSPAYLASVPALVPPDDLGRANGLAQSGQAAADILAPALAGALVLAIGIPGVLLIDVVTFLVAVGALLLVRIPQPVRPSEHRPALRKEWKAAWVAVRSRPGMIALLGFFAIVFFLAGMIGALVMPLVLAFASPDQLGLILSTAGAGLLTGSLVLSAWGGPKRRVRGLLAAGCLFGVCLFGLGMRPSFWLAAVSAFGAHFSAPFVNGLNQSVWQSRIPAEVQGRVFALREMVTRFAQPAAVLVCGPLADRVFEPLLVEGGALAGSIGRITGVGAGRGVGLMFMTMGAAMLLASLAGLSSRSLRRLDSAGEPLGTDSPRTLDRRPAHR